MTTSRLEAFSDGVLAIIITIMVLEMKVPHDASLTSLKPLIPVFLSYLLSFIYLGIYWNNHHHLFQAATRVTGLTLWANLHLLFWLSLIPFATGWMGENHFAPYPVALYGIILWCSAMAFTILARNLVSVHDQDSPIAKALAKDRKTKLSLVIYTLAVVVALKFPWASGALYVAVACIWLIPDRRLEKSLKY